MIFWSIIAYFSMGLMCAGFLFWCMIELPFKTHRNPSVWMMLKRFYNTSTEEFWFFWFCIGLVIGTFFLWPLAFLTLWASRVRHNK